MSKPEKQIDILQLQPHQAAKQNSLIAYVDVCLHLDKRFNTRKIIAMHRIKQRSPPIPNNDARQHSCERAHRAQKRRKPIVIITDGIIIVIVIVIVIVISIAIVVVSIIII
jgi:hypothetical protein